MIADGYATNQDLIILLSQRLKEIRIKANLEWLAYKLRKESFYYKYLSAASLMRSRYW